MSSGTRGRRAASGWIALAAALAFACEAAGPAPDATDPEACPECAAARRLLAERPPEALGLEGAGGDELRTLGAALAAAGEPLAGELRDYLAAAARARAERLAADPEAWSAESVAGLLDLLVLDGGRFAADGRLRERLAPVLEGALRPAAPAALRELVLVQLNRVPGFDFELSERVARAWGSIPRASRERELPYSGGLEAAEAGPIALSVFSLTSEFFDPEEAEALLAAVRRHSPQRRLAVLADLPMRARLRPAAGRLGLALVETWGRPYSPWPRDPMTFLRDPGGRPVVLVRPYRQRGREEDALMGRLLVGGLPPDLDRALGGPAWSVSPIPFHNGHILIGSDALWVSIHTLERRALEILGLERVPVERFARAAGVASYLAAVERAAADLEGLYGRPARFVHPLPRAGSDGESAAAMGRLGGGAGFDLDSVVTVLPAPPVSTGSIGASRSAFLVGDPGRGADLVAGLPPADLEGLRRTYRLRPAGEELRRRLAAAQRQGRAPGLAAFLDLVASELADAGHSVARLPLLLVPTELLEDAARSPDPEFLVGWNNVVVERRGEGWTAEGFASGLAAGDREAARAFAAAGVELVLFPTLAESVRRNGGYRCASNHLRAPGE